MAVAGLARQAALCPLAVLPVAVPLGHPQALTFVTKFVNEAVTNGTLRKAYDSIGLKDTPIRTE